MLFKALNKFFFITLFFIGRPFPSSPNILDTISPTGSLLEPAPGSIITTNQIYLKAKAHDTMSGIKEVRFYVFSFDSAYNPNKANRGSLKRIATITAPPYEYLWDCAHIPDQDFRWFYFSCEIEDRAGNILSRSENTNRTISLDRHLKIPDIKFSSLKRERTIIIDGNLKDWEKIQGITFKNYKNTVQCFSYWDDTYLYLAIDVSDSSLWGTFKENSGNKAVKIWQDDYIELFIDPKNEKNVVQSYKEKRILLGVAGGRADNYLDASMLSHKERIEGIGLSFTWDSRIDYITKSFGSINDSTDQDTGYLIEARIPWESFNISPGPGMVIGFNILNKDRFAMDDKINRQTGWSGATHFNSANPSEWGNLVLLERKSSLARTFFILVGCLLAGIFLFIYYLVQKRAKIGSQEPLITSRNQEVVFQAKKYIDENFHRDITVDEIAQSINLSASRIMWIYKQEEKSKITVYLMKKRIEAAKKLLLESPLNITEIAFKVGYKDSNLLARNFKKLTKLSPSEFKKHHSAQKI